jgi:hypothetical protein
VLLPFGVNDLRTANEAKIQQAESYHRQYGFRIDIYFHADVLHASGESEAWEPLLF